MISLMFPDRGFGVIGIMVGSFNTEPEYMDVQFAAAKDPLWHDNVNTVVVNNIVANGVGAGQSVSL